MSCIWVYEIWSGLPVYQVFMNIQLSHEEIPPGWYRLALGTISLKYHIADLNRELNLNPSRQQVKKVGCEDHLDSFVSLTPSLTPIAAHLIHQPVLEILFMKQIAKATASLQLHCHQPISNDHSFSSTICLLLLFFPYTQQLEFFFNFLF